MQFIIYSTIYIIGVLLGSFFTLAIYRLPLKQDITHTRSYCPNCNHKLNFWDLIPILSYIFLRGKCKYCNNKISPRYIIIEAISGLVYLLFFMSLKITILNLSFVIIGQFFLATILISMIFIIGGISKENNNIPNSVWIATGIALIIYITYLYIFNLNVHRYIIYISLVVSIVLTALMKLFKMKKSNLVFIQCFSLIIVLIINNFCFI